MAITQCMTTTAKVAFLNGDLDFSSDTTQTFRMALYTSTASLGTTTATYASTINEVANGNGYTTGGAAVTIAANPTSSGTTAYLDFNDATWASATITARGALIYRDDGANDVAVVVLDFSSDITSTSGNFTVEMPTGDATNAIIRLE